MPNLSKCKQKDGKLYCWDSESGQLVIVEIKPISISQAPEEIILDFIKDGIEKEEGHA